MIDQTRINEALADRFELGLASHPGVPFGAVVFRIEGSTIRLYGMIDTLDQKAAIYEVVDDFPQLRDIKDRLVVRHYPPLDMIFASAA